MDEKEIRILVKDVVKNEIFVLIDEMIAREEKYMQDAKSKDTRDSAFDYMCHDCRRVVLMELKERVKLNKPTMYKK